jgi:hypothetical protein
MILTAQQIAYAKANKLELTLNIMDLLDTIANLQARLQRREHDVDALCTDIDSLYTIFHSKIV